MESIVEGLTPLDPADMLNISLEDLRRMGIAELVALAFRIGVDVRKVQTERGRLLNEITKHAVDA